MSLEGVKKQFTDENLNLKILEFDESTATVELAAKALGVEPGQIAKTLAFNVKGENMLIVAKGDARIDNKKFKAYFNGKGKMMAPEVVLEVTGHAIGGVCPFGLENPINIYLDQSLKEFEKVYPAAGNANTAVEVTLDELEGITKGLWIDVCK
ncbi:YbaK/EbsC family protein [Clostridium botulinum]|uniref:YbaK/EbsC family protein n=1 Tax=Clostridium botulinum TaxID=1491 RepID=A0AA44BRJ9_CLOBO|nr:YbaK/EbsC family protein [Clostridium botulinum]APH20346.1 aminoacyl-tRNA editing domain protein [Clostridium botulinum]AUM93223.1 prolyl-tRNA editing protein [Clostridium botulinum]NFB15503.1 YbaK/EbsC family protein [Clostridium botulinum]NFH60255.1 YbaK/EbsC family protein [Clostridium botulinum]NFH63774.1 YbaK/EbsC family protein [Clostridium botulinum]